MKVEKTLKLTQKGILCFIDSYYNELLLIGSTIGEIIIYNIKAQKIVC